MAAMLCLKRLGLFLLLLALLMSFFMELSEARRVVRSTRMLASSPSSTGDKSRLNVLAFGAKGDGVADDTKAFQAAFAEACNVSSSVIFVPVGHIFQVGQITFLGQSCQPNLILQMDGSIVLHAKLEDWPSGELSWMEFKNMKKFTVQGGGIIDGRGNSWWSNRHATRPTALRFYGSNDVTITRITIQNSPQFHLKFDSCTGVQVFTISISSPEDSPNTNGIHLQNTKNALIHHCNIASGDDCISIQTGCSNVYIHDVNCGPGHGISVGGLGSDNTKACVSNITLNNANMKNTLSAVRIKTFQGGSGSASSMKFSNIAVSEVEIPIIIDQYYCDGKSCKNQTSAVAVSDIQYEEFKGSFTVKPVQLACSDAIACTDIIFTNIQLQAASGTDSGDDKAFCWNAYGKAKAPIDPPISCLGNGKPIKSAAGAAALSSSHDGSC